MKAVQEYTDAFHAKESNDVPQVCISFLMIYPEFSNLAMPIMARFFRLSKPLCSFPYSIQLANKLMKQSTWWTESFWVSASNVLP